MKLPRGNRRTSVRLCNNPWPQLLISMTAANQLTSVQTATPTYKHQMNLNHKWLLSFPPVTLPPQTIRASKRPAPLETEGGIGAGLGCQCLRLQGLGYFFQFLLMVQLLRCHLQLSRPLRHRTEPTKPPWRYNRESSGESTLMFLPLFVSLSRLTSADYDSNNILSRSPTAMSLRKRSVGDLVLRRRKRLYEDYLRLKR